MTMTRKDYIKFADMTVDMFEDDTNTDSCTMHIMIDYLMHIFKQDNSRFDKTRFEDYIEKRTKRFKRH